MRFLRLRRPYPYGAAIGRLIAGVFTDDDYIVLVGDDDARCRVLDRLASELVSLRCRVVRITATGPGELSLQEFVGQLSQQLGSDAGAGDTLERIHRHLTEVDASCDRIALLIERAHLLQASALRFVQLTSRCSPNLRIVLASDGPAAASLSAPELSLLQTRSSICVRLGSPAQTRSDSTST
jgi:type II secretory pathway predicted ATPase ExeA